MIAVGRCISHGNAYATYATMKENAIFLGANNMDGDYSYVVDNSELDGIWFEFANLGHSSVASGRPCTNNLVVFEISPTSDESKDWNTQEYWDYTRKFLKEMDKQEISFAHRKRGKNGKFIKDSNGKDKWFDGVIPRTNFSNSKYAAMLHRDSKSGIFHVHLFASVYDVNGKRNDTREIAKRAARAAEEINRQQGWLSAEKISIEHRTEIKDIIYDVLRNLPSFSWKDFQKGIEDKTFKNYRGEEENYKMGIRVDSTHNVVGYYIMRGNSLYNASEIGRQLSALKIMKEWSRLHPFIPKSNTEIQKPQEHMIQYIYQDNNIEIPEYISDIIRESIVLPDPTSYEDEVDDNDVPVTMPEMEDVIGTAAAIFKEIFLHEVHVSNVGGASDNDLPKKKDDEDDITWARRAAAAASKIHTPKHGRKKSKYFKR